MKKLCGNKGLAPFGSPKEITTPKNFTVLLTQGTITTSFNPPPPKENSSHSNIFNDFTYYFSHIFGAPHANWDALYPNCGWSSWDIEGAFSEIRVAVFVPSAEKAPDPDGFLLSSIKDFGILSSWIFSFCLTNSTMV